MRIAGIAASVHRPAADAAGRALAGYAGRDSDRFVWCRVETEDGAFGDGFTGRFLARQVADLLGGEVAAALRGADPGDIDALHAGLVRDLNPRGMTGVVVSALSALDVALWDLRGKTAGRPVAALLGGARRTVPAYLTCGLPGLDLEALEAACARAMAAGFRGVKLVVGAAGRPLEEDAERVKTARRAIGAEADLVIDANCRFAPDQALALGRAVADCRLAWFEEPVKDNDPTALAALRRELGIPLGAGQMEQSLFRFRCLIEAGGIDVVQPNVVFCGGFAAARAVAELARAAGRAVSPAAGWDFVNLHLIAGALPDGTLEVHEGHSAIVETICADGPRPRDGVVAVPDAPGLGITVDAARLRASAPPI